MSDTEALHEEARAFARTAAGDALDGTPSLIELSDLLDMLTDAYFAGATREATEIA